MSVAFFRLSGAAFRLSSASDNRRIIYNFKVGVIKLCGRQVLPTQDHLELNYITMKTVIMLSLSFTPKAFTVAEKLLVLCITIQNEPTTLFVVAV